MSLPSRGAWIEMLPPVRSHSLTPVAPLAGSVDRNDTKTLESIYQKLSLPSRGAWIEIWRWQIPIGCSVSLPSRGAWIEIIARNTEWPKQPGRSPRGERG